MKHYNYIYNQIRDNIINSIKSGIIKQGERLISEQEYAEKYHVSRVSIRKAYSELIEAGILESRRGSGTFAAVDAFKKIGLYDQKKPDYMLNIGVILPRMDDFFTEIMKGIRSRSENINSNYTVFLNETYDIERDIVETVLAGRYDGLVISPNRFRENYSYRNFERLQHSEIPIVMVGKPPVNFFCDAIYFDDIHATYDAVQDFNHHGYDNVVFVTNSIGDVESLMEREEGYRMGMKKFFPRQTPRIFDINRKEFSIEFLDYLHASIDRLGVQLYDDAMFEQIYPLVRTCGKRIPQRLGILGYNNYELGNKFPKKLSSIEIPKFLVGCKAFELLEKRIFFKSSSEETTHILFKPYVVHKDTF